MGQRLRGLTLWEKIKLTLFVFNLPVIIIYVIARRLLNFKSAKQQPMMASITLTLTSILFKQIKIPAMKRLLEFITNHGMRRALSKGLHNSYSEYSVPGCVSKSKTRWIVEAPNRTKDDPVLIYFHGGAYVLPLVADQYKFCVELYKKVEATAAKGKTDKSDAKAGGSQRSASRLSIMFLDYVLAPEAQYPEQLIDAAQLYHQLVDVEGVTNVSLMGDSCGGNLAIALMAHIQHPHPDTRVIPIESGTKPNAAILISPWVDLDPIPVHPASSYVVNADIDYLSTDQEDQLAHYYCPSVETRISDWYVSPLRAPSSFWQGVFPDNQKTFTVWGQREILRDDCRAFCESTDLTNFHIEEHGVHIGVIFDRNTTTMNHIVQTLLA